MNDRIVWYKTREFVHKLINQDIGKNQKESLFIFLTIFNLISAVNRMADYFN